MEITHTENSQPPALFTSDPSESDRQSYSLDGLPDVVDPPIECLIFHTVSGLPCSPSTTFPPTGDLCWF